MATRDEVNNEYFDWLVSIIYSDAKNRPYSYNKLLSHLHNTRFRYSIKRDYNRESDGLDLRRRFYLVTNCEEAGLYLNGPCSVFEMMVALALRCEETIMSDSSYGDRTGQWFWQMIVNMGLGSMRDELYDKKFVSYAIERFLSRDYEPNGKGGLFTVRHRKCDMRNVEIWAQLQWYLDEID